MATEDILLFGLGGVGQSGMSCQVELVLMLCLVYRGRLCLHP